MSKGKENIGWRIFKAILIIMAVAFIILSLGWFMESSTTAIAEPEKDKDDPSDKVIPNTIEEEKKQKQKRLAECEERIQYIEERKKSITKKEKIIFISARAVIGLFLIAINLCYLGYYDWQFSLDKQLSINGAVLLLYSFLAFISYGTPTRLVTALKNKIAYFLKKKHIVLIEELEPLRVEQNKLKEVLTTIEINTEAKLILSN